MKIIILDRDGVINQDSDKYVKNVDEFVFIPGSVDAIVNLRQAGFKVVICTNQSGLGRGLFSMEDLNKIHEKLHKAIEEAGAYIDAIIFCPHTPEDKCECRKPLPGMIFDICDRFHVEDISKLYMIGDSMRDLLAITAAGGTPILVKTGNGKKTLAKGGLPEDTMVFDDLLAASEYIIEQDREERYWNEM